MNLKTIKVLLFTLLALTLASFLIGCGVSKPVYFCLRRCSPSVTQPSGCCAGAAPSAANASAAATARPARTAAKAFSHPAGTRPECGI